MTTDELVALKQAISAITTPQDVERARDLIREQADFIADLTGSALKVGDTIQIVGGLRPQYLVGATVTVQKVNAKTVVVEFPENPMLRKWSGKGQVRIPKPCVAAVAEEATV